MKKSLKFFGGYLSSQYMISGQCLQKCLLIISFSLLTFGLLKTWSLPASGYESSIYQSTPLILWISLIISVMFGISIVVFSLLGYDQNKNYLWKLGFILIIICYAISLSLFIIHGYYMWAISDDPSTHLGWISEIIQEGSIPRSIQYPVIHLYASQINLIADLNLIILHKILPLIFGILCIIFIYLTARAFSSSYILPVLAGIIGGSFWYGWYLNFTPNHLSNLIFPLLIFLIFKYIKDKNFGWGLLLLFGILLIPIFHPIPTVFCGSLMLTLGLFPFIITLLKKERKNCRQLFSINNRTLVLPFFILIIWFILWISMYRVWGDTTLSIYETIISEQTYSELSALSGQISSAKDYGYNVVEIILKKQGGLLVIYILSALSFPLLYNEYKQCKKEGNLILLFGPLAFLIVIIPLLLFFDLAFSPLRLLFYGALLGTFLSAYILWYLLKKFNEASIYSSFVKIVVILLLVCLFFSGLLALYPSPYTLERNLQTTHSEVTGMNYYFKHRDLTIPLTGIYIAPGRFADLLLNTEEKLAHQFPYYLKNEIAPFHFGYDKSQSISANYEKETNLIITPVDKVMYTDIRPDMAVYRYDSQDFEHLKGDSGISLIYSNSGVEIWSIKGEKMGL